MRREMADFLAQQPFAYTPSDLNDQVIPQE